MNTIECADADSLPRGRWTCYAPNGHAQARFGAALVTLCATAKSSRMEASIIQDSVSIIVREDVVSTTAAGEVIILDPELGRYYSLDGVGAFVWSSLQEPVGLLELRDRIVATYDVDPDVALTDLKSLLNELASVRLVEIQDPPAP